MRDSGAQDGAAPPGRGEPQAASPRGNADPTLASLVASLEAWRRERHDLVQATGIGLPTAAEWPALPALHEVHGLWAQLRNQQQLRRALQPAPADAGPLNSDALVSRMLRLMQDASPDYLRSFTAYVDILAGLQELQAGGAQPGRETGTGGTPAGKRARPRRGRGASRSPAKPV